MTTPASYHPADPETVFTYGAPQLKFGTGASDEIGYDLAQYGASRVLVVTDPGVAATGLPQRVADQMAPVRHRGPRLRRRATSSRPTRACSRRSTTPATPARGTPSSPSAAARASTPPRRSTC